MKITILDPVMCCSTGVCGSEVDDNLVQTAANVKWLKSQGLEVNRHNISNDASAFTQYPEAISKLQKEGTNSLPYILIDNQLIMSGQYPDRMEWENWIQNGIPQKTSMVEIGSAPMDAKSTDSCCSGSGCC